MFKKITICFCVLLTFCNILFAKSFDTPNIICIDRKTERVLFNKGGMERKSIASLTKIMTAIVVLENVDKDFVITVSNKAASIGGSTVGIKKGDKIKVENLLYGLLMSSGNDCAIALAEGTCGNVENFCNAMNKKAKEIGAKNTNFVTPHGLDNEMHYSTCLDMAKIMNYALQNKKIAEIMQTKEKDVNFGSFNKRLRNTNRLLHNEKNITGGKTGYTSLANRCLAVSAKKNDLEVIAVLLGSQDTNIRFNEAKEVLDMCLLKYDMVDLSKQMRWYVSVDVEKGNIPKYEEYIKESLTFPLSKEEREKISVEEEIIPKIVAPLKKGSLIGIIDMYIEKEKIFTKNIYLKEDIKKLLPVDYMYKGFKEIFYC